MSINLFVAEDGDYDKRFDLYQTDTKTTNSILNMHHKYDGYEKYLMGSMSEEYIDIVVEHLKKLKDYINSHKNIEWFGM